MIIYKIETTSFPESPTLEIKNAPVNTPVNIPGSTPVNTPAPVPTIKKGIKGNKGKRNIHANL
jgi:hypothetical protein